MGEKIRMTFNLAARSAGGVHLADRLGELEAENSRLKRLLAELLIKNHELRQGVRVAGDPGSDDASWF